MSKSLNLKESTIRILKKKFEKVRKTIVDGWPWGANCAPSTLHVSVVKMEIFKSDDE